MASQPTSASNLNISLPPPSSTPSTAPFTPRSTTFPDDLHSDSEDVFDPTPLHSPSGPHYDDLPPTYDEAQQAALSDARNGIAPLDPNELVVGQLRLDDGDVPGYEIPAGAQVSAHRATAGEMERENRRNGEGIDVPVQQVQSSERIPVGREGEERTSTTTTTTTAGDPVAKLLSTALEFTKHEADADARFAPRLTRCVAIPQENPAASGKGKEAVREPGRRGRRGSRGSHHGRGRGRGRGRHHVPGQWPSASNENLTGEEQCADDPAQFLRAYAKALHAHSIRPAEFLDFLDGLNALCAAVGTSPHDLVAIESRPDIISNYIDAANEAFFAPRGLKVSIKTLPALLDGIQIPEERGQRAGAVASALDDTSAPEKRAQGLHPWIEALEVRVPEPSVASRMVREMGERLRYPAAQNTMAAGLDAEKAPAEMESTDPSHSIPGAFPDGADTAAPAWPSFGGWRGGRGSWGRGQPGRRGGWNPFGPPGYGPFGPPGHTPWGPPGNTPWGPPGHGPFGAPGGHGPWGARRGGSFGQGCGAGAGARGPGASFAEIGQKVGLWGEEFGRRMEIWGEQFGKRAEEMGNDVSRRAGTWGDEIAQRAGAGASGSGSGRRFGPGGGGGSCGPSRQTSQEQHHHDELDTEAIRGQETGIHHESSHSTTHIPDLTSKPEKSKHAYQDDDASSITSSLSSDSDSDSDSDSEVGDEKYPDPEAIFTSRVREANLAFEASVQKGKKPRSTLDQERAVAIEKAQNDKTALESKIEVKRMKRAVFRDLRTQRRELKKEQRREKQALKSQGLGKKSKEWREKKREHRAKKGELRREKMAIRRDFRRAKWDMKREARGRGVGRGGEGSGVEGVGGLEGASMVWVVVENLG